ncbi:MAG TPA: hypothetical protein VFT74_05180 [Isosphaeraceae bacterium]|nr:hypothetical protein [Isosphaeraceae bacterium]
MGFMDNSGEIFLDAVLTDLGREKLARNDGSFAIVRWRPSDDEIDYRFWNELTGSDSKDLKILDTPIFEASTNEVVAQRYPLVTIRNARLQFLPTMAARPNAITLRQQLDSAGGGVTVTVSQDVARSLTILPAEIIDVNYSVELDNDLLFVAGEIPVSITPFGTGKYIIPADSGVQTAAGGTEMTFSVKVQTLTTEAFDTLVGVSVPKPRTISTNITVTGQQSGMNVRIPVSITEFTST